MVVGTVFYIAPRISCGSLATIDLAIFFIEVIDLAIRTATAACFHTLFAVVAPTRVSQRMFTWPV